MKMNEQKKSQLLLSALNNVQSFGSLQQPVRGSKNSHLPEPDSIRTSFGEPQSNEENTRGVWSEIDAAERRKWIPACIAAGLVVIAIVVWFIL